MSIRDVKNYLRECLWAAWEATGQEVGEEDLDAVRRYLLRRDDIKDDLMAWDTSSEREHRIKVAIADFLSQRATGLRPLPATLEKFSFTPLQPSTDLPAARAAAANALMEASLDLTAELRAAVISLERYEGAAEAEDLYWASQQGSALLYYKREAGKVMPGVADKIEAMLQELRTEGITDITVTAEAIRAYQERLRTQGFNAEELQAARTIGLSDSWIEAIRQRRLRADPNQAAGSVMTAAAEVATALRELGGSLR